MTIVKPMIGLAVLVGLWTAANAAPAQTPVSSLLPQPADVRPDAGALLPTLLGPDPQRETVMAWLTQNIPAARGRTVYVNGTEAFWIEHQDVDPRNEMKITATLHTEDIADPGAAWRSSYQVTQFDCESQQQQHVYLTLYPGNGLTGEVKKQGAILRHYEFVGPTTLDFAHIRVVCLSAYDHVRARPYALQVP